MLADIKHRWMQAGRFGKRGLIYVVISLALLGYELVWDNPVKWFAVVMCLIIFGLGVFFLVGMKDSKK